MGKCHITDEKGDHIQDPADAEDAVFSDYIIRLEFNGIFLTTVNSESEKEAIKQAKEEWTHSDIEYEYTYIGVE